MELKPRIKLQRIMGHKLITQSELCKMSIEVFPDEPFLPAHIHEIVSGSHWISEKTIMKLCVLLEVYPNDILEWEDWSKNNE